ncbi:MAG: hypothetical protein PUB52_01730 [Lachnospiraceae bacterium]|nr:hypothetical protein [Lachnospiraceae bacterium]
MKITVNVDEKLDDTEIKISCKLVTPDVENMVAMLQMMNQQLAVTKENENYLLAGEQVLSGSPEIHQIHKK